MCGPSRRVKGRVARVIAFESVTLRYRLEGPAALSEVSLRLREGELVAVVGANGSGKSTLARLCDGLLLPSEGRVTVDGIDTADEHRVNDVRALVGMVFQDPDDQIVGTVVEEDCAFGPENLGLPSAEIRARVDEALAAVGLTGLERREPHLLSEGQKQRLAVAGALAMRPRYLVFDEPAAMLDPVGRRAVAAIMVRLAHEEGHGVLVVSHDAADAALADRVVGLAAGRIVFDGAPAGLLGDDEAMAAVGLGLPRSGLLAADLRRRGVDVPLTAMDAESLVGALWP
jgi:energy-coupling factor transport system ATP-binding protein